MSHGHEQAETAMTQIAGLIPATVETVKEHESISSEILDPALLIFMWLLIFGISPIQSEARQQIAGSGGHGLAH